MAKIFASGNLQQGAGAALVNCSGQHTGALGLLLSGTWGTAVVRPRLGIRDSAHPTVLFNPTTGARTILAIGDAPNGGPGLYYIEGYFSNFKIEITTPDGTTDIDWVLFLKPR